ncbi:MAG: tetratricopeptide repeat protein, partial [Thermodesulfobacteriota bacterium]
IPLDISQGGSTSSPNVENSNLFVFVESIKILICSLGIYIEKLLVPLSFNAYIPEVITKPVYLISAIILTVATTVTFIIGIIKKYYILSLSIFITLITLAPSLLLAIMSIGATPVAERYLFVPSIGYSLLIGFVFLVLSKKIGLKYSLIPLILLLTIFLYLNIDRQYVWKDRVSFWHATSHDSVYAFPHSNYALALKNSGDDENALKAYAVALNPNIKDSDHGRAITANNLALLYIKLEQYKKAEITLNKALELSPNYSRTFYNLGLINYIKGEVTNSVIAYEKALSYVNKASESYRRNPKLKLLKAKILMKLGKSEQALKEVEAAINIGLDKELLKEANSIKRVYEDSGNN